MDDFLLIIGRYLLQPSFNRFQAALAQPQVEQEQLKTKLIKRLARTSYGQSIGIKQNSPWSAIPLVNYGNFSPWLEKQKALPRQGIITPEKILSWQQTSGSAGANKHIPYTRSLLSTFTFMFSVWAYDLLHHGPNFCTGKTYACISPTLGDRPAGIDDTDYLTGPLRWLSRRFLVRVGAHFPNGEAFRWVLALALLATPDLEIISLWSPTFLTVQLEFMAQHRQRLIMALGDRLDGNRREVLQKEEIDWSAVWPMLKLISCWDQLFAAEQARILQTYFPNVLIQGKGLLATEAPITIPLIKAKGFVPLVNQVVLEFIAPDGTILDLSELKRGPIYELIISTLGGLYRYRLGDRLQVSHWYFETPCLTLVGRGDQVSDMVGEKLTEEFVAQTLANLGLIPSNCHLYLVPTQVPQPHYILYGLSLAIAGKETLAQKLDHALQCSFHYQRARQLGQLGPAQVVTDQIPHWLNQRRWGDEKKYCLRIPASGGSGSF
ncbi:MULTISPECIES: GH3 auxin-responsive promoter family protein [unclassified Synechocystis]|uniref:GH3 family domain-containing protein n=1 Tax=unclassified Synechocystis TaxID=2640012 RepID=UPI0009DFAC82|nr:MULTISPECIES: GH3 auxin-responsive promoter family protein [unclassified Synechocystis]MCT0254011.1 GH3 auxin-responsive promoter family protein [Synechocystis sp. CS-94]